jgi:transposase
MIVIGIDPHKSSITASAIDPSGTQLAVRRFVVNAGTARQLLGWAAQWPERRFAIEGANGLGRGTAQILVARGESVVDVPSTLAMKVRVLSTGGGRKSDPADAFAVAVTALRQTNLRPVGAEDQSTILRLLTERRDDLGHERARLLNRLHRLLRELIPGGVEPGLSADKAATALRTVRPATATDAVRRPAKPAEHSNDASPTSSTDGSCTTTNTPKKPPLDTQRRYEESGRERKRRIVCMGTAALGCRLREGA